LRLRQDDARIEGERTAGRGDDMQLRRPRFRNLELGLHPGAHDRQDVAEMAAGAHRPRGQLLHFRND